MPRSRYAVKDYEYAHDRLSVGKLYRVLGSSVKPPTFSTSLYDPNQRTTLERAIEKAAAMTGTGGQARIGDF